MRKSIIARGWRDICRADRTITGVERLERIARVEISSEDQRVSDRAGAGEGVDGRDGGLRRRGRR